MRISHILLATSLLSFSGAAGALAAGHGWGPHGDELTRGVTLSDAQKAQIKSIHQSAMSASKATMTELRGVHEQITALLLKSGTTEADLAPLVQREETLGTTLHQAHIATELQVARVMTPDQLTQAATLHTQLEALHAQEHSLMQPGAEAP